jgi:uncharacterized membrane protein YvbJ
MAHHITSIGGSPQCQKCGVMTSDGDFDRRFCPAETTNEKERQVKERQAWAYIIINGLALVFLLLLAISFTTNLDGLKNEVTKFVAAVVSIPQLLSDIRDFCLSGTAA